MAKHLVKEGRRFQPSEWLEFECDPAKPSRELRQVARDFTKRIVNLTDDWLVANGHRDLIGTYDEDKLAFDAYASIVGHGVGLWEQDGDTGLPPDVEGALDKVVKADVIASRMAHHISDECSSEREEVESHQKRVRSTPKQELNEPSAFQTELEAIKGLLHEAHAKGATFRKGRALARTANERLKKALRSSDAKAHTDARDDLNAAVGFLYASLADTKRAMKQAIVENDPNASPTGDKHELFTVLVEWAEEMVETVLMAVKGTPPNVPPPPREYEPRDPDPSVIRQYPGGWKVRSVGMEDPWMIYHHEKLVAQPWAWHEVEAYLKAQGVDLSTRIQETAEAKPGEYFLFVKWAKPTFGPHVHRLSLGKVYETVDAAVAGGRKMFEKTATWANPMIEFYVADKNGRVMTEVITRDEGARPAAAPQAVSLQTAAGVARQLGIDPATKPAGWLTQFAHGLSVELEHADITGGDLRLTGRIVLAHLDEAPDYYERLATLGLEVGEVADGEKLPGDVGTIDDEMTIMDTAAVTGSVPSYLYSIRALRALERRGMLSAPRVVGDFHVFTITAVGRTVHFARGRQRETGAKEIHAADFRSVGDALEQAEELQAGFIGPEGTRRLQTSAYAGVPGFMKRYDLVEARGLYHWPKEGVDVGYLPADAMQIRKLRGGWFERARPRAAKDNPIGSDGVPWVQITRDPERYKAAMQQTAKLGPLDEPRKIYELLGDALAKEDQEVFVVVLLDVRGQCRGVAEVHRGGRSRVAVSSADVMRIVLVSGAEGFTIVHNHPSGKADPSQPDQELTRAIRKAAELHPDVAFVDHVIIGSGEYYTFTDKKLVKVKEAPKSARKKKKGK